jgi:hypothetical protein
MIPAEKDLAEAALELRSLGGSKVAASRFQNILGVYLPPRDYYLTDVDPFIDKWGETRLGGTIPSECLFFVDEFCFAGALYEQESVDIHYYGVRTDGIQQDLFGGSEYEDTEGGLECVERNEYERNPRLRQLALLHHGYECCVCRFKFVDVYGEAAANFIHIHHVIPISSYRSAHVVNVETDLVPVCPNCHAVIHLRNPPFTIEEMRSMLRKHPS